MKKILFVDDEANVLQGLRRMLRGMRGEWEMAFAESGEQALEVLAASPFDVLVTDMRMPGMDGTELLKRVQAEHPQTVRIVLSGQVDDGSVLRSVGLTHQFLSKPCNPDLLRTTVARTCALRDLMKSESLQRIVARIDSLPALPDVYNELVAELNSPKGSAKGAGEIVARDVGMSAKILQLVNSAFFGFYQEITKPAQAVAILGMNTVRSLVLSIQVFSHYESGCVLSAEAMTRHSLVTARGAAAIARAERFDKHDVDNTFAAGLLHDAGKLILAANLPGEYEQVLGMVTDDKPLWQAEREVLEASHAEVGGYLMGLWGLPDAVVEAVCFHHDPSGCVQEQVGPLSVVHVASALELEACPEAPDAGGGAIDHDHLTQILAADRLEEWEAAFRKAVQQETSNA